MAIVIGSIIGEFISCCSCGVYFALESEYERNLRENKKGFKCPKGHDLIFDGESATATIKRLEDERRIERERIDRLERDAKILRDEAYRANEKNKRLRESVKKKTLRIKNGLCPHCDRSFTNLQRHMTTKHTHNKSVKGYKVQKVKLP